MPCQVDFDLVSEYFDSNNAPDDMGIELSIEVNTDDETQDVFFSSAEKRRRLGLDGASASDEYSGGSNNGDQYHHHVSPVASAAMDTYPYDDGKLIPNMDDTYKETVDYNDNCTSKWGDDENDEMTTTTATPSKSDSMTCDETPQCVMDTPITDLLHSSRPDEQHPSNSSCLDSVLPTVDKELMEPSALDELFSKLRDSLPTCANDELPEDSLIREYLDGPPAERPSWFVPVPARCPPISHLA